MASEKSSVSDPIHKTQELFTRADKSAKLAVDYAWNIYRTDHHWVGEIKSNPGITAQHIFFSQILGTPIPDANAYRRYLLSQQQTDGSWTIAPAYTGDLSISAEVYLALRILDVPSHNHAMRQGRAFIRRCGGIAQVRIFTRIFFAQFGLFPWSAVPQLPAEVILLPESWSFNVYRMASWARSTLIPWFILRHHEKVHALPNGVPCANNPFLDELWLNPDNKNIPYSPSLLRPWESDPISIAFTLIDKGLSLLNKVQPLWIFRYAARRRCIRWILDHQEKEGDWGGMATFAHASVQALLLEGYTLQDDCVRRGIDSIERFTLHDEEWGKRLQLCVSPVWDTAFMLRGLCGAGVNRNDERMRKAINWVKSRQVLDNRVGDWRVYGSSSLDPGGFCFEYNNSWYPDMDDTAAVILAIITQDPSGVGSSTVAKAASWVCGLQNRDGGWAAFEVQNDNLWLNKIPFSDMDGFCDPSSADVTGRVLEAFGLMIELSENEYLEPEIRDKISFACTRAIGYLASEQEQFGAWWGKWGTNYLYGTSNVICGLSYFSEENDQVQDMIFSATSWLNQMQNPDGGWGESLLSYQDSSRAGKGPSTPSQTSWVLLGLLANCNAQSTEIMNGIEYLVNTQTDVLESGGASWPEWRFTGTAIPNHIYLGFDMYRHYFPLMVLGKYLRAAAVERDTTTKEHESRDGSRGSPANGQ
ncbi:prenyltransferase and squalene oxidase repeat protein [Apiospora arundinis]